MSRLIFHNQQVLTKYEDVADINIFDVTCTDIERKRDRRLHGGSAIYAVQT